MKSIEVILRSTYFGLGVFVQKIFHYLNELIETDAEGFAQWSRLLHQLRGTGSGRLPPRRP